MHKIASTLQKNNINYSQYCSKCDLSLEIRDFALNEILNESGKTKICLLFLEDVVTRVLSSTISKYIHKLSPQLKLLVWNIYFYEFEGRADPPLVFHMQIEQFLMDFFMENLDEDLTDLFIKLFGKLAGAEKFTPNKAMDKLIDVVFNPNNYNKNQIYIAFAVINQCGSLDNFRDGDNIAQRIIDSWKYKIVKEGDARICREIIRFFFVVCKDEVSIDNTKLILSIFSSMSECQNNIVLEYIYDQTGTLFELSKSPSLVRDFIATICHMNLKNLKRDQYFKGIVDKFIRMVYSSLDLDVNLENLSAINKDLLDLSKVYPVIRLNWLKTIYKLFSCGILYFNKFLVLPVVELYLQGTIVTQDARTEFHICQEILQNADGGIAESYSPWELIETSNPNLFHAASRLLALEVLLQMAKHDIDLVINCLREKYLTFFKKRYFPDSEIHFQKLRITQAIMLLIPYMQPSLKSSRQTSIFLYDCFLEEANQNCVKQMLNWILVLLLKVENYPGFAVMEYMKRITTTPTPASASVLIALVPVIYHLTVCGNEESFNEAITLVLPWTMGAQFKLRVYAQDLIRRLFKHARQKGYKDFVENYSHLEDCINSCIASTGAIFENTMRADLIFLDDFDLTSDYSMETIFCDIPRLNKVSPTEWLNMHFYIAQSGAIKDAKMWYEKTPLKSKSSTFSSAVNAFLQNEISRTIQTDDRGAVSLNIQKKITPWKSVFEDADCKLRSDFVLIASLIEKPQNLGGLSRTCEVFGIKSLILNDAKVIKDKEFASLSMSSESWLNATEVKVKDLEDYILKCQKEGYCVVGAEQTADSLKLNEFKFPQKTALILGNEKTGIPPNLIPLLNICLEIPQFGQVRSLNVHVAGATFIWEYAKQHLV